MNVRMNVFLFAIAAHSTSCMTTRIDLTVKPSTQVEHDEFGGLSFPGIMRTPVDLAKHCGGSAVSQVKLSNSMFWQNVDIVCATRVVDSGVSKKRR